MADVQDEMALVQREIEQANEALAKAVRERKSAKGSDSTTVAVIEAAIISAKSELTAAEVKLRLIYERKDDGE